MNGAPSWDAVIILVYVIGIGYNVILHRERVAGHIASAYIALAVTSVIHPFVFDFLHGNKMLLNQIWIKSNASPAMVAGMTFLILTIVLSSFLSVIPTGRRSDDLSAIESFIYSFLWVTLLISTVMSFMPEDRRAVFIAQSRFMGLIWQYHTWWLIIPAFALIYSGFRRGSSRSN